MKNALGMAVFAAVFCALAGYGAPGFDLGEHFSDTNSWMQTADAFVAAHRSAGFKIGDEKKTSADCLVRGTCTWNGLEVWEARVYFAEGGVQRVEMSLYNRGDDKSGGMGPDALNGLLAKIREAVPAELGKPGSTKSEKPQRGSVVKRQTWKKPKGKVDIELAWGETGNSKADTHADFARVVLTSRFFGAKKAAKKVKSARGAKGNVRREENGDVWIDNVPMVDQGQKGYCAAATAERVLRYYGHPVDEHEIAQIAGTTAQGGTSTDAMRETVRKAASKYRLGYNEIVDMNGDPQKAIKAYNSAAKRLKKPEISYGQFLRGNTFMIGDMIAAMQPDVIKEMREKDFRAKMFVKKVREQIDKGNPVFWSVTLGIWREPGLPQQNGGHMRLIIGYNKKTNEILYSDSWGAAHALKRMPGDWAFAITDSAFFLRTL
ncbi:MAG: C39 family peptidase [Kiritimatiellae bacterium]|nr:C39 family peptidase [Kiritimatiellia bacterium]